MGEGVWGGAAYETYSAKRNFGTDLAFGCMIDKRNMGSLARIGWRIGFLVHPDFL
jgi:hypothetical protein